MSRIVNGIVFIVVAGLLVAILRQFDYDPFAAAAWAFDKVWAAIDHSADFWSDNETFQKVTEEPKK